MLIIKNKERFVEGGIVLLNIYLYPSVLMKLHPCPLLLLIYFALNYSVPGIDCFLKNGVYLIGFSASSFKESPHSGTSRNNNTVEKQPDSSQGGFCCIFPC